MLSIRVEGDWGGAQPSDVAAVVTAAASTFALSGDEMAIAIAVTPTERPDDPPITLSTPNDEGEIVVRLAVRGNLWARLAYQFAHEFCHVLADVRTWPGSQDRSAWVEEVLCETGSLFALRAMASRWVDAPPFPQWQAEAANLTYYVDAHLSDPDRSLPPGVSFPRWLSEHRQLLERDLGRRSAHTIVARQLLPIFESDACAWRAIRRLHAWRATPTAPFADFARGWLEAAPATDRPAIRAICRALCIASPPT